MADFKCSITKPELIVLKLIDPVELLKKVVLQRLLRKAPVINLPDVPKIPSFNLELMCPMRCRCPKLTLECPMGYIDRK